MTLTELSRFTRRTIPFVVGGIVLFYLTVGTVKLLLSLSRPKTAKVTYNTVFGKLPPPSPVNKIVQPEGISYKLDTPNGKPIEIAATANVYFLPPIKPKTGVNEQAFLMAKAVGFNTEKVIPKKDNGINVFEDLEKKLTIQADLVNFNYEYNYKRNPFIFTGASIPKNEIAQEKAREFLRLLGRYLAELAQGQQNVILMKYSEKNDSFEVVKNASEANVVEVDFFRPDIDGIPIVSSKYFTASNFVVMVFRNDKAQIIKAKLQFFEKDTQNVGVYPIKTGKMAWEELQKGGGFIVSPGGKSYPIKITHMFLGYYDPETYEPYLQPVFVFLGENNFVAYVPAVIDDYLDVGSAKP